jgi:hypothetical protein
VSTEPSSQPRVMVTHPGDGMTCHLVSMANSASNAAVSRSCATWFVDITTHSDRSAMGPDRRGVALGVAPRKRAGPET